MIIITSCDSQPPTGAVPLGNEKKEQRKIWFQPTQFSSTWPALLLIGVLPFGERAKKDYGVIWEYFPTLVSSIPFFILDFQVIFGMLK